MVIDMNLLKKYVFLVLICLSGIAQSSEIDDLSVQTVSRGDVNAGYQMVVYGRADFTVPTALKNGSVAEIHVDRISHVPEPEGWTMLMMGLGFVVYQIRRRRKKDASWDLK